MAIDKGTGSSSKGQDPVIDLAIKQGPMRPFIVSEPPKNLAQLRTVYTLKERILVSLLAVFTVAVRMHNLSWPNAVIFDEVHFGGFASKYIKGTFFMDVHPPFAKMLFAWIGQLGGFQGDFDFETIGKLYPTSTPYVLMRSLAATSGALTVLFLYFTLRSSGVRVWVALASAICFAVENSFVTISRYILLDAPLMVFIAGSVYAFKRYEIYQTGTWASFKFLVLTGVALGLAVSSKWVGLFTIAWIGLLCIWRLWLFLGDLSKPVCSTFKIAVAKGVFLLGIPAALYMLFFYIHFQTLTEDADGAGFFSPEFRSVLNGNTIPKNILADVGVGSTVTMRHLGTMGGYLHSHSHEYPAGSQQQQITLYPHLDNNNEWYIRLYNDTNTTLTSFESLPDETKIRLLHPNTHRRLHSHDHKPPVSENSDWQKEVSGYGFEGFDGDANDDWIIEIDQSLSAPGPAREHVRAIETKFRLRHAMTGCYLFSHEVKLPKWGFEQQEVTCAQSGKPELLVWYIESNRNQFLPEDAERVSYNVPSFLEKFIESHKKMWHVNKNLVDFHVYESLPSSWPLLLRGIGYWSAEHRHVYLLGNAIMWWSVSLFSVVFAFIVLFEIISWQVGKPILQDADVINFHLQVMEYLLGFVVHLAPSFLMSRQLFLHHYLPAYYFGILAFGHALEIVVSYIFRNRKVFGYAFVASFTLGCIYFFQAYSPLIYGTPWTKDLCQKSQWLSGWDYGCDTYLDTYQEYDNLATSSGVQPSVTPVNSMEAYSKPSDAAFEADLDTDLDTFDEILNKPGEKNFVDENGNPLEIEEVRRLIAEEGGGIKKVEEKFVQKV